MLQQIVQLFRNAPDLLDEFKLFLPTDPATHADLLGMFGQFTGDGDKVGSSFKRRDKSDATTTEKTSSSPQKRKRKPIDKELPHSKLIGTSKVCVILLSGI